MLGGLADDESKIRPPTHRREVTHDESKVRPLTHPSPFALIMKARDAETRIARRVLPIVAPLT